MSDPDTAGRDDLAAAVADDPEAVAAFVDRRDAADELLDHLSLDGTPGDETAPADGLAPEETDALASVVGDDGDDLAAALETLVTLQRSGALDDLAELAQVGSLASAALTDEMVRSLAGTGGGLAEVAHTAAAADTRAGVERLLDGVGAAEDGAAERVGPVGTVRALRDPDVQYGVGYLLAIARALGRGRSRADDA